MVDEENTVCADIISAQNFKLTVTLSNNSLCSTDFASPHPSRYARTPKAHSSLRGTPRAPPSPLEKAKRSRMCVAKFLMRTVEVAKRRERNEWHHGVMSERERDRAAARPPVPTIMLVTSL